MPLLSDDGAPDAPDCTPAGQTRRSLLRHGFATRPRSIGGSLIRSGRPVSAAPKDEIATDPEDLKVVQVFKPGTNVQRFAEKVYADVLS